MFLLIPLAYSCNYHCRNALNSIMFLLIPQKWRIYEQSNANFKFHYVSINSDLRGPNTFRFSSFKFHYVSINSDISGQSPVISYCFKFHYVSINSGLDLLYLQVLISLNSIMFLLILIDKQGAGDRKMALNSIMFLLIQGLSLYHTATLHL